MAEDSNISEGQGLQIDNSKPYDVMTIGNALMDMLVRVDEPKFLTLELEKGTLKLVDSFAIKKIEDELLGHEMILEPGGASANTLSTLALLGSKVIFCGSVGKDESGKIYEKKLIDIGVTSRIAKKDGLTGRAMTLITPDSQRTFAVHLGVASRIGQEDILEEDIKNSKILYLTSYELIDEMQRKICIKAMELAEKHGTRVALDLADPVVVKNNLYDLKYIVERHVHILFANESEAKAFTDKDAEEAIEEIKPMVKIAIVKIGADGSLIKDDKKTYKVRGFKADAVDTTGAGDTYAAGILYGIVNNIPLERAGLLGSYLAARVVEKIGARLSKSEAGTVEELFENIEKQIKKEATDAYRHKKSGDSSQKNVIPGIIDLGDGKFNVMSQKEPGKMYLVDLNTNWCDCPSLFYNKQECKHLKAVKEWKEKQK